MGMDRKTALITGASRPLGLGFAVARQLAEQDDDVILTARDAARAEERAAELRAAGAAQQIARADVSFVRSPAYSLAKYTLNALTATLAAELAATSIRVNAVDPGRVASHPERGEDADDQLAEEAARVVVWAATLGPGGPHGSLISYDGALCVGALFR